MSSSMDKLAKSLHKSLAEADSKKPKPYDTEAEVSRVDGDTLWVKIPGGENETPVRKTMDAKPGDNVMVRVSGGRAWAMGNSTRPPTDDSTAISAYNYANTVNTNLVQTNKVIADTIEANEARFDYVEADTAKIHHLDADEIEAGVVYTNELIANDVTTESLTAADGYIKDLTSENITAQDISADHATIGNLDATYATIDELHSDYAEINLANVNNAWIQNGTIKKAEVFDENVFDLSGNRATLSRLDASKINVANLRADNLIVRRINGQPVVGGYTLIDSNSSGYASKNPQALGWYEFVNAEWVLSTDTTVDMTKAYYQEGDEVSLYDQEYIDGLENDLQQQIDGAVETYTGTVVPTLVNWPYTDWYDTSVTPVHDERAKHVGDIYYVVNSAADENGYCYRFAYDNTTHAYSWVLIKDSDVTKALSDISDLQTFESETTSWIDETDEGIETIRTNYTTLSGRVDDVEDTANAALPATTFESFESTTFTDLVDEVDEQSTTMTNMTTRLGLNADGTGAATDIVAKESALEQTVDGISTRVSKTETKLIGMYATSTTAAGTAAKVATITPTLPSSATWELGTGTMVTVKFMNANTTASPTLNVNSKGAKGIRVLNSSGTVTTLSADEYKWAAGSTFTFTYNGTYWLMQDSSVSVRMNSNETSISQTADSIISLASGNTTYTKPDGTTVTSAIGTTVSQTANNVLIKATRTDATTAEQQAGGTSAAALINVTPDTVKIAANHVEITGSAVFNAIDADATAKAAMLNSELQIGGRNLLLNSKLVKTGTTSGVTLSSSTKGDEYIVISGTATAAIDKAIADLQDITVTNTSVTISANYVIDGVTSGRYFAVSTTKNDTLYKTYAPIKWYSDTERRITINLENGETLRYLRLCAPNGATFPATAYRFKVEVGNKQTDWTPAPEDVQAEIDAKKSMHTIQALYSDGNQYTETYANILSYSTEGRTGLGCRVASLDGIKIGDTVRLAFVARDMNNATVYIIGTVTNTSQGSYPSLYWTSHGLDTTVIDGGHILTGTIDASKVNVSNLTVGAFGSTEQNKILNEKIEIGGRNLLLATPKEHNATAYRIYQLALSENLVVGETYTLQFWGVSLDSNSTGLRPYWGGESNVLTPLTKPDSSGYWVQTFTVGTPSSSTGAANKWLNIYNVPSGHTGANGSISKWKLEKGNKATDWTPAPEDTINDNLVNGSQKMDGWKRNSNASLDTSSEFGDATLTGSSSNWLGGILSAPSMRTSILDGSALWLSLEYKASVASTLHIEFSGTSANPDTSLSWSQTKYRTWNYSVAATSSWTKLAYPMPTLLSELTGGSGNVNSLFVSFYNRTDNSTMHIRKVKLEHGLAPTEWTPSPEDFKTFITRINDAGIRIHPSSTEDNSVVINATGMEVFKGGTNDAYSVAKYGDTARVGKSGSQRVEVTTSAVDVYDSSNNLATRMNTNGLSVYNQGSLRVQTTSDGMDIYGSDSSTFPMASINGVEFKFGRGDYNQRARIRCTNSYAGFEILQGTTSANIAVCTLSYTPSQGVKFFGSGIVDAEVDGMTINSTNGVLISSGLRVNGHSTPIGSVLSASSSNAITTAGIDTYTQGASLTIPTGSWVITGSWAFNTGSSSSARNIGIVLSTSSGSANTGILSRQRIMANNNGYAQLQVVYVGAFSADTTVYVKGASSMTYTTASANSIRAVRIA